MTFIASLSRHTLRQLKFIIPGGLVTFWLNTHNAFWNIFTGDSQNGSWARTSAFLTVLLGVVTVSLFMYILLVPLIQGIRPDFHRWRQSGVLSSVIPVLTGSIVFGWTLTAFTLGRWTELGYLRGIIGASGLYALAFGLMGLIPAPKLYHRS
ncbi:hypothetical protein BDY19DRAFT_246186 [Irpex rosettiformis]|uniref:Uncharacterized protein n=1 Tax=Irpex rosettiformis TaxID=378272 RepID=A0ACB8TZS0_9APHY|nr:hypothetical protein BDY19DRAFT_246186 [Irpex rosettiformis]